MDFKKLFLGGKSKLVQGLAAGIVGALAAVGFFAPGLLDRWEAKTWDWRVNLLAKPSPATPKIRLILLDQNSLDWARTKMVCPGRGRAKCMARSFSSANAPG